ncbi:MULTISPECIES: hypothetical protein [unclassified Dietzia]|uniref:hypothetical protein n=1 Tax=unclassified Dietzia TaxID=2617939 RepID=UPI0015F9E444|nr:MULTISPECIES: hypothetical protein [unclassified Dietzia]
MRTRVLLTAGAIALVAASCAQPEPQVLSEAPRSASATDLTSAAESSERDTPPGRFIARCATEADGGTPGMTVFTDGTQSVTDHCLSRYYIGVQPAPGALYVADDETGTHAPPRQPETGTTATQWTPAQPRTDAGGQDPWFDDDDPTTEPDEPTESGPGEPTEETTPDGPTTPPEGTTPPTTPPTSPPTGPGDTETTTPGAGETTAANQVGQPTTGSDEPAPTAVPTETETDAAAPPPPQASGWPPFGWMGSHDPNGSFGSEWLPSLPAPVS